MHGSVSRLSINLSQLVPCSMYSSLQWSVNIEISHEDPPIVLSSPFSWRANRTHEKFDGKIFAKSLHSRPSILNDYIRCVSSLHQQLTQEPHSYFVSCGVTVNIAGFHSGNFSTPQLSAVLCPAARGSSKHFTLQDCQQSSNGHQFPAREIYIFDSFCIFGRWITCWHAAMTDESFA